MSFINFTNIVSLPQRALENDSYDNNKQLCQKMHIDEKIKDVFLKEVNYF
jgi:hypothetical protein